MVSNGALASRDEVEHRLAQDVAVRVVVEMEVRIDDSVRLEPDGHTRRETDALAGRQHPEHVRVDGAVLGSEPRTPRGERDAAPELGRVAIRTDLLPADERVRSGSGLELE